MPPQPILFLAQWLRRAAVAALLAVLLAAPASHAAQPPQRLPRAQRHEGRHKIDQLEDAWRKAVLSRDAVAMDAMLSDDFMAISANGMLQSKDQMLQMLRADTLHITALELSDRKVRFYGATALVTSSAAVTGSTPEGDITGNYRYTHVYVRDARGAWKAVSFEASRVRAPGDAR